MDAEVAAFAEDGQAVDAVIEAAGEQHGAEAEGEACRVRLHRVTDEQGDRKHDHHAELPRFPGHEHGRLQQQHESRGQSAQAEPPTRASLARRPDCAFAAEPAGQHDHQGIFVQDRKTPRAR